jgi:hypothetical protein
MMEAGMDYITEKTASVPVVDKADVLVVGGGPAGIAAAVAAARQGASVILAERYPYLGGLASGGMVIVLDDMCNGDEISVRGINSELIERMQRHGLCVVPPCEDRRSDPAMWRKWSRWGVFDFHSRSKPQEICYAAAFDPDAFKRASNDMIEETKVKLRLHSWFSSTIVEDGKAKGVICDTKSGRQALLGSVVIDTTGDLDVAASAGAAFTHGSFIVTTVFRLGNVDEDAAERFEFEEPEAFIAINREAKRILGGSWEKWWLRTPLPGIVWCNAPHMTGLDGLEIADLTRADLEGRKKIAALLNFVRSCLPGFERACIVDVAPQLGVRQTRLLDGVYVMTKQDVANRRHFADTVARGRDYYYPYRSFLPRGVDNLLVAGRHYSATPEAQRISREIPPCIAMGEAVGVAAAVALADGVSVADVDIAKICRLLRAAGADPGDQPAANASLMTAA